MDGLPCLREGLVSLAKSLQHAHPCYERDGLTERASGCSVSVECLIQCFTCLLRLAGKQQHARLLVKHPSPGLPISRVETRLSLANEGCRHLDGPKGKPN